MPFSDRRFARTPPGTPRLFAIPQTTTTSDDYYTPRWMFDRMQLRFDLDVAAPPGGVEWVPAARYYTQLEDGLAQPWHGRVWMNPPYSDVGPWWQRFAAHRHGVALLPIVKSPWMSKVWETAEALTMLARWGDLEFPRPDNPKPLRIWYPVLLAAFGDDCVDAIGRLGTVRKAG